METNIVSIHFEHLLKMSGLRRKEIDIRISGDVEASAFRGPLKLEMFGCSLCKGNTLRANNHRFCTEIANRSNQQVQNELILLWNFHFGLCPISCTFALQNAQNIFRPPARDASECSFSRQWENVCIWVCAYI